jgi:hypothetical protein
MAGGGEIEIGKNSGMTDEEVVKRVMASEICYRELALKSVV